ncbi:MAG: glycosyltransferase family 39 protein, partial [Gemmatimonadota bacterium]
MPSTNPAPAARRYRAGLVLVLLVVGGTSAVAASRTSTTFDEIVLVAAGARALETGSWSMVLDQPPLMPLLYGLPVWAAGVRYPSEVRERGWTYDDRWEYARALFFGVGNDPERVAWRARLVALALAMVLIAVAYAYGVWIEGPRTGLIAAFLVGFLPDVMAHAGVAYNDVPMALAYLLAVWALDAAIRRPSPGLGVLAGAAVAGAAGVKFSALALAPVAGLLLVLQLVGRDRTRPDAWGRRLGVATALGIVAAYALLVLTYRGDTFLVRLEYGLRFTVEHASEGHPAPAWLFGRTRPDGWWYFFPAAFLVKTPAALHALVPLAAVGL